MSGLQIIDRRWLGDNPLPSPDNDTDKNNRGRVLAVGGSLTVPGAMRLTAEAALRAGAGKVRMAVPDMLAVPLGLAMPEAGIVPLPSDEGEIAPTAAAILRKQIDHCDAAVIGPAVSDRAAARALLSGLIEAPIDACALVLDAACVACAGSLREPLRAMGERLVLTPHHGEMAACLNCEESRVSDDPVRAAQEAAAAFRAVVVLKSAQTIIAAPGKPLLRYGGGGVGLATGGSGDVLAGIIAGLISRGADPWQAAAWGVWLHGEAGARLAHSGSTIGFLARELLPEIPRLLP